MTENYLVIGDIHGRYDLLMDLLHKISARENLNEHRLVFLGDMIDRGPHSYEVVSTVKKLVEEQDAIALLGNHEDFALEYFRKGIFDKTDIWFYGGNGGSETVRSYTEHFGKLGQGHFFECFEKSGHAKFLKELPMFYETEQVWFSHAPIRWSEDNFRVDKKALLWTYIDFYLEGESVKNHGKLAVCGHIHALRQNFLLPRIYPNIIYADTGSGCSPKGPLTAIDNLAAQTAEKENKLLDLIKDGNDAINNLLEKLAQGVDYTEQVNKLKAVSQKNADMIAAIESADAVFETEAQA